MKMVIIFILNGLYDISFKSFLSIDGILYDYITTKYTCNMTINICWERYKICKGDPSQTYYQQFCYECIEGYSLI